MNKVEESALEAYPKMSRISEPHGEIPADNETHYLGDVNAEKREAFIKGYHQAEKDLELTWEDIQLIVNIDWDLDHEGFSCGKSTEEYYKEVLKQFNEEKKRE